MTPVAHRLQVMQGQVTDTAGQGFRVVLGTDWWEVRERVQIICSGLEDSSEVSSGAPLDRFMEK